MALERRGSMMLKLGIPVLVLAGLLVAGGSFLFGYSFGPTLPVPVHGVNNSQGAPPPNVTVTTNASVNSSPVFSSPFGLGPNEALFYTVYLQRFVAPTGAAISNVIPVRWCPNSCIGCDGDVTSEAVSRSTYYSTLTKDKPITDRYTHFYNTADAHPGTGFMMWKLNNDTSVGSCGGQNSAVDAELIMILALDHARATWMVDGDGTPYLTTETRIMHGLSGGIITTTYGQTLPFCMYPTSNNPSTAVARPCGDVGGMPTVYIGYLDLRALNAMCGLDTTWCPVYAGSKKLSIAAIQNGGIMTSYQLGDSTFGVREHYIHNLWVLKHLLQDGSTDSIAAAKPLYLVARAQFYTDGQICGEFNPGTGCKTDSRTAAYAEYLSMASALHDDQFVKDLITKLQARCALDELGEGPILCGPDNYGNIAVLQGYADARAAGYTVG